MSDLSELRITDSDVAQHGVVSAPDMLTGSAQENKSVFDGLIRDLVKEKHNGLVTALEESLEWEPYDAEKSYVPDNKVVFNGSSYLCTAACKGVLPTNASCWRLIAAKGADGTGAGDMRKDVYDPRGMETDVFAYAAERANTYTKDEAFSKAQSLSAATAQKFVDAGMAENPPETPDEAFDAFFYAKELVTEVITESGTWTTPKNIVFENGVNVRAFGGGGGGGSTGSSSSLYSRMGGGGGGGYMEAATFTPEKNKTYSITIGVGGEAASGSNSGAGGNGGATSFDTIVTANGGGGGNIGTGGDGGSGGGGGCGNGGNGAYGGGGGGSSGHNGGTGGAYGGGGGGGGYGSGGGGGGYGGNGGDGGTGDAPTGGAGYDGTDTTGLSVEFNGSGDGGAGGGYRSGYTYSGGGGGGGGYGGNGGNGGNGQITGSDSGYSAGGGGGGGYGGNGGGGGYCSGGGGGGYGGSGRAGAISGHVGGGGGGGYGSQNYGAGGAGGSSSYPPYSGKNGVIILQYYKYLIASAGDSL